MQTYLVSILLSLCCKPVTLYGMLEMIAQENPDYYSSL